jgi:hypothetical protein
MASRTAITTRRRFLEMDDSEVRDQLRNAVSRWSVEDQLSWAIFALFMAADGILVRNYRLGTGD